MTTNPRRLARCLFALSLAASLGHAAPTRPLTAEDLTRLRSAAEVDISPDGATIAYILTVPRAIKDEESGPAWGELHLVATETGPDRPFVTGKVNASLPRFSPDGSRVAFLAKRNGDTAVGIYAIAVQGGEAIRLVEHKTDILAFDWRPDGKALAFVATEPTPDALQKARDKGFKQQVVEEDVAPQRPYVAELNDNATGSTIRRLTDFTSHCWNALYSPDGARLLVDAAPAPSIDDRYMFRRLTVIDASSGKTISRVDNIGKLGPFEWSADGGQLIWVGGSSLSDTKEGRLFSASASGGAAKELLPNFLGHVDTVRPLSGQRALFLASVGVKSQIGIVPLGGGAVTTLFEAASPVFEELSVSTDGQRAALIGSTITTPREVFSFALDARAVQGRTNSNPWLSEIGLAPQQVFRWKARDGLDLEGLLLLPTPTPATPLPLIVIAHGGPESHYRNGWVTSYSEPAQLLATRGYAVFLPNYRGSTGRGVAFATSSQRDPGGKEFDDLIDGIDALIAKRLVDKAKVGITGGSYGGYFTGWGCTKHSARFAAGVMFVGISEIISKVLTTDIPWEERFVHSIDPIWKAPQFLMERSPIMHVPTARTPLLILHGKDDPRVHPSQSLELHRALKMKGDVPVRLVLYPGEGHGNKASALRYDYTLRLLQWFDHFIRDGKNDLPPWKLAEEEN